MLKNMKALIVGLGSMGKRRIRNLKVLGVADIRGFDLREDRRQEATDKYGIATFNNLDEALAYGPDAVIISLPPDLHVSYAHKVLDRRIPFFTEASVVTDGMPELIDRLQSLKALGAPSCTMRYYAGPRRLKKIIHDGSIGKPLAWTYHSGQHLLDWHPWEPIQSYYVSKKATGGCREILAFELVWLVDLFGGIAQVDCQKDKLSDLPAEIDDLYQLQIRHLNGVRGQLMVDVLARPAVRLIRIVGSAGTVEWDATQKIVRYFSSAAKAWVREDLEAGTVEKGYVNPEEPYVEEMADFLSCVSERRGPAYSFEEDLSILRILESAEESDNLGTRIRIEERAEQVRQ
jgi:predicted dehydrogenase